MDVITTTRLGTTLIDAAFIRRHDLQRHRFGAPAGIARAAADRAEPFRFVDLFCGASGVTLGFVRSAGHFRPVWANDCDEAAVATYNANFSRSFGFHTLTGPIEELLDTDDVELPVADLVVGGPPCQGFSPLNRKREADERRQLWRPFLTVVDRCGAGVFVMENVPQLVKSPEYKQIREVAEDLGFTVRDYTLCAADYGVAQLRRRAFIVGCRFADPDAVFPPPATNRPGRYTRPAKAVEADVDSGKTDRLPEWRTVRELIADLPRPFGTEIRDEPAPFNLHFGRLPTEKSVRRYKAIPEEGMDRFDLQKNAPDLTFDCWKRHRSGGTDVFGRLWWDRPAFTIRTEFYKPEKGRYLHPEQHRPLTHREAARLQSFPDRFRFCGTKIEIARQIGNAVPPLLAARVADCVYRLLLMRESERCPIRSHPKIAAGSCPVSAVATRSRS